jgi:hypothetical protein
MQEEKEKHIHELTCLHMTKHCMCLNKHYTRKNEAIKGNVQTKEIVRELSKDDRQYFHFSIRYRKVSTIWWVVSIVLCPSKRIVSFLEHPIKFTSTITQFEILQCSLSINELMVSSCTPMKLQNLTCSYEEGWYELRQVSAQLQTWHNRQIG